MITFIPNWDKLSDKGVSADDLIGQIRSFIATGTSYKIIIDSYIPNLRYFLHRYDLLEGNYYSIFDSLQGFLGIEQRKISLEDLNFPEGVQFYFTPFNILVYFKKELIGKVYLGEGAQVYEVHHFMKKELNKIEIYDDRGFVSSIKKYKEGKEYCREYLDLKGDWIFHHYTSQNNCIVNTDNSCGLLKESYDDFEALKEELIEKIIDKLAIDDTVIYSLSNTNIRFLDKTKHIKQIIVSIFKDRFNYYDEASNNYLDLLNNLKGIMVDSQSSLNELMKITGSNLPLQVVTPYDTHFELSKSQELKEEVIFVDLRELVPERVTFILESLLFYISEVINKEGEQREFEVICRTSNLLEGNSYLDLLEKRFFILFPEEFKILRGLKSGENNVEEDRMILKYPQLNLVKQLYDSFTFTTIYSDDDFFTTISRSRLIIDLREEPDLFLQISGISAGIPQINLKATEYVKHKENGWILDTQPDIYQGFYYYMESLKNWQNSRSYSVQQIKKYSGVALRDKILKLSGEEQNG